MSNTQFVVNAQRFDPYKNFKFRVKWDGKYVAGISKVGMLKRTTEVVKHRDGGDPSTTRKSPGRTEYEAITLDRGAGHLKDELMPKYAELVYYGFWFAPEREMLQAAIDKSQERVTGQVTMKLYKGNATVIGRESDHSLYDQDLVTFEEGSGDYDQQDAAGFIKLNALRLRTLARRKLKT